MNNILIRKATTADLQRLLVFEQGVIAAERPFDNTLQQDPIHYYNLSAMIKASHIELLVAELGGLVIGSGYARIENAQPYLKHAQYAYLGFMYTDPPHRGKGVNQKIVEALTRWSLKQGVEEFRLDVYYHNASAIKAYEKAGFSHHMITMRMGAG